MNTHKQLVATLAYCAGMPAVAAHLPNRAGLPATEKDLLPVVTAPSRPSPAQTAEVMLCKLTEAPRLFVGAYTSKDRGVVLIACVGTDAGDAGFVGMAASDPKDKLYAALWRACNGDPVWLLGEAPKELPAPAQWLAFGTHRG